MITIINLMDKRMVPVVDRIEKARERAIQKVPTTSGFFDARLRLDVFLKESEREGVFHQFDSVNQMTDKEVEKTLISHQLDK